MFISIFYFIKLYSFIILIYNNENIQVSVDTFVPTIFGVLTVLNKEQAIQRSTGEGNEGLHWGKSAVEMGLARMTAMGIGGRAIKAGN